MLCSFSFFLSLLLFIVHFIHFFIISSCSYVVLQFLFCAFDYWFDNFFSISAAYAIASLRPHFMFCAGYNGQRRLWTDPDLCKRAWAP